MTIFTLYQYTNRANAKRYIGVTTNPTVRSIAHARAVSGVPAFNAAVRKYGIASFDYKVLAVFDDLSAAAYHERAAIVAFGTLSPEGYNLTVGAPGTEYGGMHSHDSRSKNSAAHLGNQNALGNQLSLETRGRMSAAKMGIARTAETRANISAATLGHVIAPETRAKIAAAKIGRFASVETRAKISAALTGKHLSAETRAKISAARKAEKV